MPSAANQNVYTGADGTILLAPAGDGPEGGAASAVINSAYDWGTESRAIHLSVR